MKVIERRVGRLLGRYPAMTLDELYTTYNAAYERRETRTSLEAAVDSLVLLGAVTWELGLEGPEYSLT